MPGNASGLLDLSHLLRSGQRAWGPRTAPLFARAGAGARGPPDRAGFARAGAGARLAWRAACTKCR